ncbi:hypothetical protein CUR178_03453 [Leishmania enriettii]|uniref:Uncharacterized protein n=1 Tax=Leishmania enriettii TaxID=5663 RepID=A0A836KR54_LEIEN|nr:hypothetical protein CUR178_03453 [Leishmania enriettii]
MTDHALLTGTVSNAFEQPASAWVEAGDITSARSYYHLTRSYSMPGIAGSKVLAEPLPLEVNRTMQRPIECLSRPPRLRAEKPLVNAAESLQVPVPVRPAGTPLMLPLFSLDEGTHRHVTACAHSSLRAVTSNGSALVSVLAVAEEKAKPVLRPPARNTRAWPEAEMIASSLRANHACVEQLPGSGRGVLPARRLQNRHVSKSRTPPKPKGADSSATLWSEAALEADVLAFFGSQDAAMSLTASLSLRADHKAPFSKESSLTVVDTAQSSLCGLSVSDCIFSAEAAVTDKSSVSGVFLSHVIDPQAVLSFHRDGARRQRDVPKAVSDARFR